MTLLLDTHIWLWSLKNPAKLPSKMASDIGDPRNQIYVSAISIWETGIKRQLGKLPVEGDLIGPTLMQQMRILPFDAEHAQEVENLPAHHRDPFDRALIAQARVLKCKFLTVDRELAAYRNVADIVVG